MCLFYQHAKKTPNKNKSCKEWTAEKACARRALVAFLKLGTLRRRLLLLEHEVAEDARARRGVGRLLHHELLDGQRHAKLAIAKHDAAQRHVCRHLATPVTRLSLLLGSPSLGSRSPVTRLSLLLGSPSLGSPQ